MDQRIARHEEVYQTLLALNAKVRALTKHEFMETWFRDVATISWDSGPTSGKSAWIAHTLTDWDLVVCSNDEQRSILLRLMPGRGLQIWPVAKLGSLVKLMPRVHYHRIFIYNAMWLDRHMVYAMTLPYTLPDTTYVCLG